MNHAILILLGSAAWLGGVSGLLLLQRDLPMWPRLAASLRFRVSGTRRSEILYALLQVLGLFWIVAGLGFWLIRDVVNPGAIATLVALVYVMPILLLVGASVRRK